MYVFRLATRVVQRRKNDASLHDNEDGRVTHIGHSAFSHAAKKPIDVV